MASPWDRAGDLAWRPALDPEDREDAGRDEAHCNVPGKVQNTGEN